MFCKYCGNEIDTSAKFCGSCGSPIDAPAKEEHTATPLDDLMSRGDKAKIAKKNARADKILSLGIASVAFANTGILALVGWIVACVARRKVREYENRFGPVTGKAKVGRDLARGGLIGSICMTLFLFFYFLMYAFALIVTLTAGDYDNGVYYNFADLLRTLLF